jgi:hypothetical protein
MSNNGLFARLFSLPMTKQIAANWVLRGPGFVFGLISILGGIAAWNYVSSREPERYLVSAVVMIVGGVLWMMSSAISRYQLSRKQMAVILGTLFLGLTVGLLYTFSACGGECGLGASFCRWEHGYPGYWLITGGCYGPTNTPASLQIFAGIWRIDVPGLLADIVFWSAAGMIIAFLWQIVSRRTNKALVEN